MKNNTQEMLKFLNILSRYDKKHLVVTSINKMHGYFHKMKNDYDLEQGLLCYQSGVVIPKSKSGRAGNNDVIGTALLY